MIEIRKRIFSITMVKNEEDIIESFVRYNINIFDGMIILDNGSSDNTLKILNLLKDEGLSIFIFEDKNTKYDQFNKLNELLLKAVNEYKADLVVPLDADEFITSTKKGNPRKILEKMGPNLFAKVKWKTYVPDFKKDYENKFIPKQITLAREDTLEEYYKVIVPKELVTDYKARVTTGCHNLVYDHKYENEIKCIYPKLRISHFPLRSKEQTFSKIVVGWINTLQRENRGGEEGYHWQKIFNKLKENEDIENEDVINYAKQYALKDEVTQIDLIDDPIDITFCNNLEIIYLHEKTKPISNLLENFERISISHIDFKKETSDNINEMIEREKLLKIEINQLMNQLAEETEEKNLLKSELAVYGNSLSWKITSPIRKVGKSVRNLRD